MIVSPQVILNAPRLISICSDLKIDRTSSIGSAGRAWKSVVWSVKLGNDSSPVDSVITNYLQATYTSTDTFALITTDMFRQQDTDYLISLRLTNLLNILSVSSIAVTVSATLIVPYVTLASPAAIYPFSDIECLIVDFIAFLCGQYQTSV